LLFAGFGAPGNRANRRASHVARLLRWLVGPRRLHRRLNDVDAAVTAADKAFSSGDWPRISGAERAALLRRVAARIEAELDELALVETLESGKPISQAKDEIASADGIWYYAASLAQQAYGDAHNHLGPNYLAVTVKEPVGVVGVITRGTSRS
jgi:betaine-aldehyde dehydrogenase